MGEIFHDHYRVYDKDKKDIPIIKKMLKFWQFEDTELNEFVNFSSNAVFMRSLRTDDVLYTHDMDELVNVNRN